MAAAAAARAAPRVRGARGRRRARDLARAVDRADDGARAGCSAGSLPGQWSCGGGGGGGGVRSRAAADGATGTERQRAETEAERRSEGQRAAAVFGRAPSGHESIRHTAALHWGGTDRCLHGFHDVYRTRALGLAAAGCGHGRPGAALRRAAVRGRGALTGSLKAARPARKGERGERSERRVAACGCARAPRYVC